VLANERSQFVDSCVYVGRFHPFIGHKGSWGEKSYSYTLFLTSALEGGEGSASRPRRTLPPGKHPGPTTQEAGWASGPVWTGVENLALTGIRSPDRAAHTVALPKTSPGPPVTT
jgi:hypothetical protein